MTQSETNKKTEPRDRATFISAPFIIVMVVNFFQTTASYMMNTTLPLYCDSIGAGAAEVGFVVGAFAIMALLIRPFSGPAFDSFSRKWLLIGVDLVSAACLALYSFATTVPELFAVRVVHGIGIGCAGPLAMSLVSEFIPLRKFAVGISVYSLAQSLAMVVGPAAGIWLSGSIGFTYTYYTASSIVFISIISLFFIREPKRERLPYKLKLSRMFAREAVGPAAVLAMLNMPNCAINSYMVLYGNMLGIGDVAYYFVVYALCMIVTRPLFGHLADSWGTRRMLVIGIVIYMLSLVMISQVKTMPELLGIAVIASAGYGACNPLVQSIALSSVPEKRRGAASNTAFTGLDIGMLLGPSFAGLTIEFLEPNVGGELQAYSGMWLVMLIPSAIALLIVLAGKKKHHR